jgi:hypothetical protein
MGDPAFDERKFAVGVPICRTRVLADQSGAGAGLDVMRLPDGRLVQCVPAEYVLLARTISNFAAYNSTTLVCACAEHSARICWLTHRSGYFDSWSMNAATQAEHTVNISTAADYVPLSDCVEHNQG